MLHKANTHLNYTGKISLFGWTEMTVSFACPTSEAQMPTWKWMPLLDEQRLLLINWKSMFFIAGFHKNMALHSHTANYLC